jgi:HEPN domain-containing protein
MQRADRQAVLARRWLSKARTDLVLATVVLERDREGLEGWAAAFHAQQAAEKALKAVLVARGEALGLLALFGAGLLEVLGRRRS